MTAVRRAYIRVDGDHRIGLGHIFRMQLLARELEGRGWRSIFCCRAESDGFQLLAASGCEVLPAAVQGLQPNSSGMPLCDVAIFDLLDTEAESLRAARNTAAAIVTFDDCVGGPIEADLVVNAMPAAADRPVTVSSATRLLTGFDYMLLDASAVQRAQSLGHPICPAAERLFLSFGGTDTYNITERVLAALSAVPPPLSICVNLGPGFRRSATFAAVAAASAHPLVISSAAPNLFDAAAAADLVLCAGGMTLFEMLAAGRPVAAVSAEPHETLNIAAAVRHGAVVDLGKQSTMQPGFIASTVAELIRSQERRVALPAAGRRLIDGYGVSRCAEAIEALVGP
jgi:UDP-2,4-diacetamido-2,4,6-trideoxy-beta-L-altropyranose hydrolase